MALPAVPKDGREKKGVRGSSEGGVEMDPVTVISGRVWFVAVDGLKRLGSLNEPL